MKKTFLALALLFMPIACVLIAESDSWHSRVMSLFCLAMMVSALLIERGSTIAWLRMRDANHRASIMSLEAMCKASQSDLCVALNLLARNAGEHTKTERTAWFVAKKDIPAGSVIAIRNDAKLGIVVSESSASLLRGDLAPRKGN